MRKFFKIYTIIVERTLPSTLFASSDSCIALMGNSTVFYGSLKNVESKMFAYNVSEALDLINSILTEQRGFLQVSHPISINLTGSQLSALGRRTPFSAK